jgi:hypothetical protein
MKIVGVALVFAALGCSGKPSGSRAPRAVAVLPDVPYEMLDHDQRVQFMKERVVPAMKPLFQRHDAQEFADFGCKTCHGDAAAAAGDWHMPSHELPAVDFANLDRHDRRDLDWMRDDILPAMARLLGEKPIGRHSPDGFGCLRCHPAEVSDAH